MRIIAVFLVFGLLSCQETNKVISVNIVEPQNQELSLIFNVDLEQPAPTRLVYWTNNSDFGRVVSSNNLTKSHESLIDNIVPNQPYKFRIDLLSENDWIIGDTLSFSSSYLPELPKFAVKIGDGNSFDGYIMLRKTNNPAIQLLLRSDGQIVWKISSDSDVMRPFKPIDMDGFLVLSDTSVIEEINYAGDTLLRIDLGRHELHHEITKLAENRYSAITKEYSVVGQEDVIVAGDGIIEFDSTGSIKWQWSIFDSNHGYSESYLLQNKKDFGHANALFKTNSGDYIISFRDFDQIWKINYETGKIMWKLGSQGDFGIPDSLIFDNQHAAHIDAHGNLMLFDNNMKGDFSSRAICLKLDESNLTVTPSFSVELPDSLFSFKQGSVFRINDDRLLFCSSMTKTILITDLTGNIIWLAESDESFYRAEYISNEIFNSELFLLD